MLVSTRWQNKCTCKAFLSRICCCVSYSTDIIRNCSSLGCHTCLQCQPMTTWNSELEILFFAPVNVGWCWMFQPQGPQRSSTKAAVQFDHCGVGHSGHGVQMMNWMNYMKWSWKHMFMNSKANCPEPNEVSTYVYICIYGPGLRAGTPPPMVWSPRPATPRLPPSDGGPPSPVAQHLIT